MDKCMRCGIPQEFLLTLGHCRQCLVAIIADYHARLDQPIDYAVNFSVRRGYIAVDECELIGRTHDE